MVLFNNFPKDSQVQVGDKIDQLILEEIKTPTINKVKGLSATVRDREGFGSSGLQSIVQVANGQVNQEKSPHFILARQRMMTLR